MDLMKMDRVVITRKGLEEMTDNILKSMYLVARQPYMKDIPKRTPICYLSTAITTIIITIRPQQTPDLQIQNPLRLLQPLPINQTIQALASLKITPKDHPRQQKAMIILYKYKHSYISIC
jgi:hypothetical protein